MSAVHLKNISKLVNFCVAILILTREENIQHFRHIVLCYFEKGKNATEPRRRKGVCRVWRRCCDERTCQKWFAQFRAGDFLLDDAPRSGRPAEVDSEQIETLMENNQCSTTGETANILKISKRIKLLVKMKNTSFILRKKTERTFWPAQYFPAGSLGQSWSLGILSLSGCGFAVHFPTAPDGSVHGGPSSSLSALGVLMLLAGCFS